MTYDSDLIDRLIREARELLARFVWQAIPDSQSRRVLTAMADQLEAARAELALRDGVIASGNEAFRIAREKWRGEIEHWREARRTAMEAGEVLKAEVERLRLVVTAAVRVVELDEIADAHPGLNDEIGQRAEAELYAATAARTAAIDAYRAAKGKT